MNVRELHIAAGGGDRQKTADSVEKVAPLFGLRQNCCIGQQGSTQHDGTVIEWAGATVLLVQ
ncbi:hypothetical protein, partial [Pseudomonas sp. PDM07]|uniref:hypothetical protein n=1 Tax=Pseudomonas sp. PDM07 TaxID=2769264 RepID=UPI001CE044F2